MMATPAPFDSEAPLEKLLPIIRRNPDDMQEIEMVEARWGSDPRFSGGTSYRFVRSEGKTFASHRCLVPASEFHMTVGDRKYRVTLDDGNFFYLAAVWEPAVAEWPVSFRVVTVTANPEVSRYQDRHGAIILRRQRMLWLDHALPEGDILETPPARTFIVEEIAGGPRQSALVL